MQFDVHGEFAGEHTRRAAHRSCTSPTRSYSSPKPARCSHRRCGVQQAAATATPLPRLGHPAGHRDVVRMERDPVGAEREDGVRLDLVEQAADRRSALPPRAGPGRHREARGSGGPSRRARPSLRPLPSDAAAPGARAARSADPRCPVRRRSPRRRRHVGRDRPPPPSRHPRGRSRRRGAPRRTGSFPGRRWSCVECAPAPPLADRSPRAITARRERMGWRWESSIAIVVAMTNTAILDTPRLRELPTEMLERFRSRAPSSTAPTATSTTTWPSCAPLGYLAAAVPEHLVVGA